jgi:DNA-binding NarL/FixJ family response regulator
MRIVNSRLFAVPDVRTRVFMVDDSKAILGAIRALLDTDPRFEIAGTAETAGDAIERAVRLQPHVITMDLGLPDRSGLDATRILKSFIPQARIVVVTMSEGPNVRQAAFEAGADAFVHKTELAESLLGTLRAVRRAIVTSQAERE